MQQTLYHFIMLSSMNLMISYNFKFVFHIVFFFIGNVKIWWLKIWGKRISKPKLPKWFSSTSIETYGSIGCSSGFPKVMLCLFWKSVGRSPQASHTFNRIVPENIVNNKKTKRKICELKCTETNNYFSLFFSSFFLSISLRSNLFDKKKLWTMIFWDR